MPDIAAFMGNSDTDVTHEALWAATAWRRIQEHPAQVAFKTPVGTTLAAQTVRLEVSRGSRDANSEAGTQQVRQVIVFGVKDHASEPDTDIKSGYRFVRDGKEYQVKDVVEKFGELQARAEVVS